MRIKRRKILPLHFLSEPPYPITHNLLLWLKSMRSFLCHPIFLCRLLWHNSSIAFSPTINTGFIFETDKVENSMRSYFTSYRNYYNKEAFSFFFFKHFFFFISCVIFSPNQSSDPRHCMSAVTVLAQAWGKVRRNENWCSVLGRNARPILTASLLACAMFCVREMAACKSGRNWKQT